MNVSFYKAINELTTKAICQLLEKCYDNQLITVLMINNLEILRSVDKILWTYSRKRFLPHATFEDKLNHLQPIFLTDKIENPNNAKVLMLLNPQEIDLKLIAKNFERLIIIYNEETMSNNIAKIQQDLKLVNTNYNLYNQSLNNSWIKN